MIGIIGAMEEEVSQLIEAMEEKEKVSKKWLPEGKTELPLVLGFRKK